MMLSNPASIPILILFSSVVESTDTVAQDEEIMPADEAMEDPEAKEKKKTLRKFE